MMSKMIVMVVSNRCKVLSNDTRSIERYTECRFRINQKCCGTLYRVKFPLLLTLSLSRVFNGFQCVGRQECPTTNRVEFR